MRGGGGNVAGFFPCQLNNVLPQIRFYHFEAGRDEMLIELGFLGDHGLAFGDLADLMLATDIQNQCVHFLTVSGEVYRVAIVQRFGFELAQIVIEVVQAVLTDALNMVTKALEITKFFDGVRALEGRGKPELISEAGALRIL